ncbi:MAG: copper resistance protein CopC, partial [Acidimicrobiia bacterium]|nr:copper resistance protein CopC [Acidimicrobiia bacterium]
MTDQARKRRCRHMRSLSAALLALLTVLAIPSGVALAHTSFVGSTPEDGATVADPVSTITLAFSGDSEPAGDGFTVLTPDGEVRAPTSALTVDQRVFTLTFDPPLAGGTVGVRWSVKAPDKHPIEGSFSFTVTAPATPVADVSVSSEVVAEVAPTTVPASAPLPTDASTQPADTMVMADGATMTDAPPDTMVMADGSTMAADVSMDEFLAVSSSRPGEGTARSGRIIEFAALTLLVGAAAFAATTLRGRREEIERAIAAVRLLGAVLVVGALV